MFKQTALITWAADADEARKAQLLQDAAALVSADLSRFAPTVSASHRGGDVVWHLHFADKAAWEASGAGKALDLIEASPAVAGLDAAAYAVERSLVSDPGIADGIYRTLFVSVEPGTSAEDARLFADDLAGMRDHIPAIVNWAVNATTASRGEAPWTHVWEQEFRDVGGLTGPYMSDPYHWAYVDRWFDPEMPGRIIDDANLRHSASVLESSVMIHY